MCLTCHNEFVGTTGRATVGVDVDSAGVVLPAGMGHIRLEDDQVVLQTDAVVLILRSQH